MGRSPEMEVVVGAGLRSLAAELIDALATRADSFEPWLVLVPHRDVQVWLKQEISEHLGVCMNVEFTSVRGGVRRLAERALGERPKVLDEATLSRLLLLAFDELAEQEPDAFAPIARLLEARSHPVGPTTESLEPLSAAGETRRRLQLAADLASRFLAYEDTHPEILETWARGDDGDVQHWAASWQGTLWRKVLALNERLDDEHRRVGFRELLQTIGQDGPASDRVLAFGYSTLTPLECDALAALAVRGPVTVLVDGLIPDGPAAAADGSLVRRWGRAVDETLARLRAAGAAVRIIESEDSSVPAGSGLATLRAAICDPAKADADVEPDDTLVLLGAPGERREAEVVTNAIWDDLLTHGREQGRKLNDVALLSASYESQIPWLEDRLQAIGGLVFSTPFGGRASRLLDLAHEMFRLLETGAHREAVLGVLAHPCFRGSTISETASTLLREGGVFLGLDEADPELAYLEGAQRFHWEQGLQRLHAGAFVDGDALIRVGEEDLPAGGVSWLRGEALELHAWASSLLGDLRQLAAARLSGEAWARLLEVFLKTYVQPQNPADSSHFFSLLWRVRALADLDSLTGEGADRELDYSTVVETVFAHLGTEGGARGEFRAHGIPVGRLTRNRGVPFAVVCVTGLTEGAFPTRDTQHPLDVRHGAATPPPSEREAQQLAFLQAVMSAERRLVLSYDCRDAVKDSKHAPSSVIAELQETLPCAALTDDDLIEQPLNPYSTKQFDGRARPTHHQEATQQTDAHVLRGRLSSWLQENAAEDPFAPTLRTWQEGPLAEPCSERLALRRPSGAMADPDSDEGRVARVTLWSLRALLVDPVAATAEARLNLKGWNLDHDADARRQHEPFTMEKNDLWKIGRVALLEQLATCADHTPTATETEAFIEELIEAKQREGVLPHGVLLAPDQKSFLVDRALQLLDALHGLGVADAFRGIPVLGPSSTNARGRVANPAVLLDGERARYELTHEKSALFGPEDEPVLVTFHGSAGNVTRLNSDFRLSLEVVILAAAGLLGPGKVVRFLHVAGENKLRPLRFKTPSRDGAVRYLATLADGLGGGLHPWHLPTDVLPDRDTLVAALAGPEELREQVYGKVLERLAATWRDREAQVAVGKAALRNLEDLPPPTIEQFFAVVEARYLPLFRMELS